MARAVLHPNQYRPARRVGHRIGPVPRRGMAGQSYLPARWSPVPVPRRRQRPDEECDLSGVARFSDAHASARRPLAAGLRNWVPAVSTRRRSDGAPLRRKARASDRGCRSDRRRRRHRRDQRARDVLGFGKRSADLPIGTGDRWLWAPDVVRPQRQDAGHGRRKRFLSLPTRVAGRPARECMRSHSRPPGRGCSFRGEMGGRRRGQQTAAPFCIRPSWMHPRRGSSSPSPRSWRST